jgi:hypothetical protein
MATAKTRLVIGDTDMPPGFVPEIVGFLLLFRADSAGSAWNSSLDAGRQHLLG